MQIQMIFPYYSLIHLNFLVIKIEMIHVGSDVTFLSILEFAQFSYSMIVQYFIKTYHRFIKLIKLLIV